MEFWSFTDEFSNSLTFPDNWFIIYTPWLSSDWKTYSDSPGLFQFSLTWMNPAQGWGAGAGGATWQVPDSRNQPDQCDREKQTATTIPWTQSAATTSGRTDAFRYPTDQRLILCQNYHNWNQLENNKVHSVYVDCFKMALAATASTYRKKTRQYPSTPPPHPPPPPC